MVKESIENPFKWKIWLGGVHVGLRVRVQDTIAAYGYVSVTVFVFRIVDFLGLATPEWFFLLIEFPLH